MLNKTFSGYRQSQNEHELSELVALFHAEGVCSYGEIGAREGDTFHDVVLSLPPGSKAVAVDFPGAVWGRPATRLKLERAVADLVEKGYQASAIFGDSRAIATIGMFKGRGPYDAILIDGDHTLEGVTADWAAYRSSAQKIVAFHDIAGFKEREGRTGARVEVPALWRSIKANGHRTKEFIAPRSTMGIGVVWT